MWAGKMSFEDPIFNIFQNDPGANLEWGQGTNCHCGAGVGAATSDEGTFFAKMYAEMKELGPVGGARNFSTYIRHCDEIKYGQVF